MKVEITEISKLSLKPGDTLLVKLPENTSQDAFARIKEVFEHTLRDKGCDWPIVFATDQIQFSVIEAPKGKE